MYTYDVADNRIALTDPLSRTTQYGHDADHELTAMTYALTTTPNVAFTYTPSGQRQSMTDGTGTSTYQYDALDRVITSTNGAGQTVGNHYDLAGNLSTLIYPDGSAITRTYDAANRLTGLTDWAGRRIGYSYDAADRLIQQTYPTSSPLTTTLGYNTADQLTYMLDSVVTGTLWAFGYSRDKLGQVNGVSDPLDGPTHLYGYTPLNQLAADIQTNGVVTTTTAWGVDAAGDLTQTLSLPSYNSTTLGYDAAHELTSLVVSGTTPLTNTYSYNADGDRISASASSGTNASYGWDQADRLITATTTSGRTASYSYDGDRLRQSKTISGSTEAYTWDSAEGQPLLLQDGTTRYIDGPDGLPVEEVSGNTTLYFLRDQVGSTRGLVTSGGQVAASYSYTPYGSVKAYTGGFYTPFLYAGQYTDGETGFQYLQARYYDPATSQFLSVDPLVQQTQQPYAYVGANPLNMTDPSGLCSVIPCRNDGAASSTMSNAVSSYATAGSTDLGMWNLLTAQAAAASGPSCAQPAQAPTPMIAAGGGFSPVAGGAALGLGAAGAAGASLPEGAGAGLILGIPLLPAAVGVFGVTAIGGLIYQETTQPDYFNQPPPPPSGVYPLPPYPNPSTGCAAPSGQITPLCALPGDQTIGLAPQPIQVPSLPGYTSAIQLGALTLHVSGGGGSGNTIVGTPFGTDVVVPAGWVPRTADNGRGIVYQRPGATNNADMIRIMEPTPLYPDGYVRYYNQHGQPVDVNGNPGPNSATHIPLDYQGALRGWPR